MLIVYIPDGEPSLDETLYGLRWSGAQESTSEAAEKDVVRSAADVGTVP